MAIGSKYAKFMRNTGFARFFIPLGIMLLVFGIVVMLMFGGKNMTETNGRILEVNEGFYDEETDRQQYDLKIAYTADGAEYTGELAGMYGNFKVGDILKVYYDPAAPNRISNTKSTAVIGVVLIAAGALALFFGIFKTVKAFKKSKELDERSAAASTVDFTGFRAMPGVSEYYFHWDQASMKPGYILEDADRNVLFEGKTVKNSVMKRTVAFDDRVKGTVTEHEITRPVSVQVNNSAFGTSSSFKVDGENIWDLLHDRGFRLETNVFGQLPNLSYNVAKNGEPFAQFESTGMYVHEEDEAQHKFVLPMGHMFYRCWTNSDDFESLFLLMYTVSENPQLYVD